MRGYADFEPTMRFKETLALSRDGSHVAYVDDVLGQFNVAVQPLLGGPATHVTTGTDSGASAVAWYPDGSGVLYLADTKGDQNDHLYRAALRDGESEALTGVPGTHHFLPVGDPFSPDGGRLAYTGNDHTPHRFDLLIRDLPAGATRRIQVDGAEGALGPGHWSPDGNLLTVVEVRGGRTDRHVHLVRVGEGTSTRLAGGTGAAYWLGPWLPDGSGFLVRSNHERDFLGLAVMDTSGKLDWLDTPQWDVEDVALSPDGRTLVWSVNVDGASQLRVRDLGTGRDLPTPDLPPCHISSLAITGGGGSVVMLVSTPTRPANVATLELGGGALRWLTGAAPAVDSSTFIEPELLRYPTHDGRQISAYLYRPVAAGPVPVVLAIHGGPALQERPGYSNDGLFQYLASRGVAVLAPNVRGSTGYGLTFQQLIHRDWGGGDLGDFAAAAEHLRGQDWVDAGRMALLGKSYGGFAVLSCLSRLPAFDWAAAVDWCGPSNLVTAASAVPPAFRSQATLFIGDPEKDAEFLLSRSPVTYADQIRAPLFIIQGANDTRVPQHESDQIVELLRARGVEVRYDIYPDEGHLFGKRENQTRARSSIADFLLTHLLR